MLSTNQIDALLAYAQLCAPNEMCGLMFPNEGFVGINNVSPDRTRSFQIAHDDYVRFSAMVRETAWAIVHSHPDRGASPSVKDCRLMDALQVAQQDLAMVIVGLQPVEIRVFKKNVDLYRLVWSWAHKPADADEEVKA